MGKKADLLEEAEAEGHDVDDRMTIAELEALLGRGDDSERVCPNCGNLHGSSFVPEGEVGQLEGVKLSALPKAKTYRVFRCDDAFHVVPHAE